MPYISRKDRRIFPTQIPILKAGGAAVFPGATLPIHDVTAFGLETSSRVRLTQQSWKRVGHYIRGQAVIPHVNTACTIISISLATVCLKGAFSCVDFMDVIMGDIPVKPVNNA